MVDSAEIREHAEVISADGIHVGTVDRVEGDRIKLTKKDSGPGQEGHHHFIPLAAVESIDGNRVRLNTSSRDVMDEEEEADRSRIH